MKPQTKNYKGFVIVTKMTDDGYSESVAFLNNEPKFGCASHLDKLSSYEKIVVKIDNYLSNFYKTMKMEAIGKFVTVSGKAADSRKRGYSKVQKIIGDKILFKSGKKWFWSGKEICKLSNSQINILIEEIQNSFKELNFN